MSSTPFIAGGALTGEQAAIYIERKADRDALARLRAMDYLLVIEPRKQGKSSLINHLMRHLDLDGFAFVYIDVSTLDRSTEAAWYQTLCPRILRQLRSFIPRDQWPTIPQNSAGWHDFLWNVARFAVDVQRRMVIALDEIGAVTFPGAIAFFGILRGVHNSRQAVVEFKQLTFLLAGAFHPIDLIKDNKVSPFNIGHSIRLSDFTAEQTRQLIDKGEWTNEQANTLAQRIYYWTDGQPYLTQLLCSYLKPDAMPIDVDTGVERLRREDKNHLLPLLEQLKSNEKLYKYIEQILVGKFIKFYPSENRRHAQLELLGVIKTDAEGYCVIRNRICEQALRLLDEEMARKAAKKAAKKTAKPKSVQATMTTKLRQTLITYFDESELHTLCTDLGVDYESLPGEGKANKARELIKYLKNRDRIPELEEIVKRQRPNVSWDDTPQETL